MKIKAAIEKSHILIEALPYIRRFRGSITVVKYGGSILEDSKVRHLVLQDIAFMNYAGLCPILIHGGGVSISRRMEEADIKSRFIEGLRVTEKEGLPIVCEELDKLNTQLAEEIDSFGIKTYKVLSDNTLFLAEQMKLPSGEDLGFVGRLLSLDKDFIMNLIKDNIVPVIAPLAKDDKGEVHNINADSMAAFIASSLKSRKLVYLTNVKGIKVNKDNEQEYISSLKKDEAEKLIQDGIITEGMLPKVKSGLEALNTGVEKVHIVDACLPHALLLEIFTDEGIGTEITK